LLQGKFDDRVQAGIFHTAELEQGFKALVGLPEGAFQGTDASMFHWRLQAERILLDGVDFFLRGEADARFDALIERGRALQLQPPDVVELMEWKGLSAVRAGRLPDGMGFLEQARAAAAGTIAESRVTQRMAALAAERRLTVNAS